jgi:hypothetical protein
LKEERWVEKSKPQILFSRLDSSLGLLVGLLGYLMGFHRVLPLCGQVRYLLMVSVADGLLIG